MKQKFFVGALALGLFGAFTVTTTDADGKRRGGFGRKIGGAVKKVAKVAKPFAGFAKLTPIGGIATGMSMLKGVAGKGKKGGLGGLFSMGKKMLGNKAGSVLKNAKGLGGKAKGALGKAKGALGGKAKGMAGKLKGKSSKFKKLGSKLMKPGGLSGMVGKFGKKMMGKAGTKLPGPFSLIGKMTKGRTGIVKGVFGKFLGGKRAGQMNKLRGMVGFLANKGGKGLTKIGNFAKKFGPKLNQVKGKIKAKLGGIFGSLKKKFPQLAKHLDAAQAQAVEETTVEADQAGQAAVETQVEEKIAEIDPAAGAAADADSGQAPEVNAAGEPTEKASASPEASEEAAAGVSEAAVEANVDAAPAPVEEGAAEAAGGE